MNTRIITCTYTAEQLKASKLLFKILWVTNQRHEPPTQTFKVRRKQKL